VEKVRRWPSGDHSPDQYYQSEIDVKRRSGEAIADGYGQIHRSIIMFERRL
jgi:hypothetical protein